MSVYLSVCPSVRLYVCVFMFVFVCSRCAALLRWLRIELPAVPNMHLSDFLLRLLPTGRTVVKPKRDRMLVIFTEIVLAVGTFVELHPLPVSWDAICFLDLGVLGAGGSKARRISAGFKFGLTAAAKESRGRGCKRPSQISCGLGASKRSKSSHVVSKTTGYRCELFKTWNYYLSSRIQIPKQALLEVSRRRRRRPCQSVQHVVAVRLMSVCPPPRPSVRPVVRPLSRPPRLPAMRTAAPSAKSISLKFIIYAQYCSRSQ